MTSTVNLCGAEDPARGVTSTAHVRTPLYDRCKPLHMYYTHHSCTCTNTYLTAVRRCHRRHGEVRINFASVLQTKVSTNTCFLLLYKSFETRAARQGIFVSPNSCSSSFLSDNNVESSVNPWLEAGRLSSQSFQSSFELWKAGRWSVHFFTVCICLLRWSRSRGMLSPPYHLRLSVWLT